MKCALLEKYTYKKKRGVLYSVTRNFEEPKLGRFCIIFWKIDFAYMFCRVLLGQFQRQSISFFNIILSLLFLTYQHGYEKINEHVPFHVHDSYINSN
jgi:hypothetical protein